MTTARLFCEECNKVTETLFDHDGELTHTVCSECGITLKSNRTLRDDSGKNIDPNPVKEPWNPPVVPPEDNDLLDIISGFRRICTMSDMLGLVGSIKDSASEIFLFLNRGSSRVGKTQGRREAILAACLYVACRQAGNIRSGMEICSVANHGITLKELYRANEFVDKKLRAQQQNDEGPKSTMMEAVGTGGPGDYMTGFCSKLGSSERTVKAAMEAVKKSEEFNIRRAPSSVAAAVLYVIDQLSGEEDDKMELKDVALLTGVASDSIKHCLKELYPHFGKIVPSWYAQPEDLLNTLLCLSLEIKTS